MCVIPQIEVNYNRTFYISAIFYKSLVINSLILLYGRSFNYLIKTANFLRYICRIMTQSITVWVIMFNLLYYYTETIAIFLLSAALIVSSLSKIIVFSASIAMAETPASSSTSMVSRPIVGKSKRIS